MADAGMSAERAGREKGRRTQYVVRFSAGQRVEHAVLMVTFIVLSVTGLAQRYYTADWAEFVILNLGGIEYTRLVHRAFGLLFTLSAIYHFGYVAYIFFAKHRKLTMVPTLDDFRGVVGTLKYTFGFGEKPPQFGRYDYRQKFEYWGVVFGGMVIIVTGYFLAFPLAVTRFLPGEVVAAAVELHGFEATLAVLTIVIWHLYDVSLRPGIFPADTTIFTGRISRERMLEEHAIEYAERVADPGTGDPPPESPPDKNAP